VSNVQGSWLLDRAETLYLCPPIKRRNPPLDRIINRDSACLSLPLGANQTVLAKMGSLTGHRPQIDLRGPIYEQPMLLRTLGLRLVD
jgi:hypothetical protein